MYKQLYIFPLLILLPLFLSGCESSSERQLREEIGQLRAELRELKQLKYDVDSIENDLRRMRGRLSSDTKTTEDEAPIVPQQYTPDGSHRDDPFLGPKDAEVIVMAFGDFQCRPCRKFYDESFKKLKEDFTDTEKVRFIYRDFPLRTNAHSAQAATMAHCAGEQGAYWQMFELLFEERNLLDSGNFPELAKKLPSSKTARLLNCATSDRYDAEQRKDIAEGVVLGAKGAPGFFVGRKQSDESYKGVFIRGAQPYPVLRAQINKFL